MNHNEPGPPSHVCHRVRLAESSVASVDMCDCGVMHLNMGPFSLRLCPHAMSELLSTLGRAVAAHAARRARTDFGAFPPPTMVSGRGQA